MLNVRLEHLFEILYFLINLVVYFKAVVRVSYSVESYLFWVVAASEFLKLCETNFLWKVINKVTKAIASVLKKEFRNHYSLYKALLSKRFDSHEMVEVQSLKQCPTSFFGFLSLHDLTIENAPPLKSA